MRLRQTIGATIAALALGTSVFVGSASAQGVTQGGITGGLPERYLPPGPAAPVVVPAASGSAARPSTVSRGLGVPSAADEISVTGNYPGTDARQLYCVVYGRSC